MSHSVDPPTVPEYLLSETEKAATEVGALKRVPPGPIESWTREQLINEVRRLNEEITRMEWERDSLTQYYASRRGSGDGWI